MLFIYLSEQQKGYDASYKYHAYAYTYMYILCDMLQNRMKFIYFTVL